LTTRLRERGISAAIPNANLRLGAIAVGFRKDRKMTVLVVEDEPLIRIAAVDLVEDLGFGTVEAASADEAIAVLEQRTDIGVVFTDIHMAGSMDGLELAAYVRNRWPPINFIVVSGEQRPTSSQMPVGAYFFAKPYDVGAVSKALVTLAA
jgi:two-component system, response regulator PdtaR